MNEERKTATTCNDETTAVRHSSSSPDRFQFQCTLHGTHLCPHPEDCSGYDNRKCDNWRRHSGK